MSKSEKIIFKNVIFRRYPNSKYRSQTKYYTCTDKKYISQGITTLHREIWKDVYGNIPVGYHIHHKDGNTLNNNIENLECIDPIKHRMMHLSDEELKNLSNKTKEIWKNKNKIENTCLCCGNKYLTYWKNSKFCGGNCATKDRDKRKIDHIDKKCVICDKIFKSNKYSPSSTCSRFCADKKASKTKEQKKKCHLMNL